MPIFEQEYQVRLEAGMPNGGGFGSKHIWSSVPDPSFHSVSIDMLKTVDSG